MHKEEQKKKEGWLFLSYKRFFTAQNIVTWLLFSHNSSSGWILGKNLLYFCFIKTFSKLLFGFPFVLNPLLLLNNHREKQIINGHIYYGLKSISVMLLVTRHVGASLINLEETFYDFTRKAILNFGGSNILFSSLLWLCFFMYVRVVL